MAKKRGRKSRRLVLKNKKVFYIIIIVLLISLLDNAFSVYHFLTFNHKKVKTVIKTKVKTKEVVPENVLFLGDSITEFYDLNKYYPDKMTVNSGINGNKTSDILDNMQERVYRYNPSTVFLLIGTNDMHARKDNDYITDNIKKIIDSIKENRSNAKIYVESVYPINDTDDDKIDLDMVGYRTNKKIKDLNEKIKVLCEEEKITYIDMYSLLVDESDNLNIEYTKEGLHMSEEGYEVITKKLNEYIS